MKNFDNTKLKIRLIHKVIRFLQSANIYKINYYIYKLNYEKIVRNLPKESLEQLSPLTLGWFAFEFAFQASKQGGILDINNQ